MLSFPVETELISDKANFCSRICPFRMAQLWNMILSRIDEYHYSNASIFRIAKALLSELSAMWLLVYM